MHIFISQFRVPRQFISAVYSHMLLVSFIVVGVYRFILKVGTDFIYNKKMYPAEYLQLKLRMIVCYPYLGGPNWLAGIPKNIHIAANLWLPPFFSLSIFRWGGDMVVGQPPKGYDTSTSRCLKNQCTYARPQMRKISKHLGQSDIWSAFYR